ncbi:MAG: DNA repair protein RecN [Coriobacteriales bacterium]|nr:DNA repair protein RecN [Coriobacteriales bacterium]
MLLELRVRDLALIAAAELEFAPGLTVLSGETGAGKTALINSLKLLVGERADSSVVRSGATETRLEALFSTGSAADSPEYLVSRRLGADGRSRCYLNDSLVTVKTLAQSIGPLVDLYGQHQHQSLLRASEQLRLLDAYGGQTLARTLLAYQEIFSAHAQAQADRERLQEAVGSTAASREQASFLLREIAKVNPQPGEDDDLRATLPLLQNGEELVAAAEAALRELRGEGRAVDSLAQAAARMEGLMGLDPALDALANQLQSLEVSAAELARDLRSYRDSVEFDPEALEQTLNRLGQLEGLIRRFGPLQEIMALRQQAELLLADAEDGPLRLEAAESRLAELEQQRTAAAAALANCRHSFAQRFCAQLAQAVGELAMPQAAFEFAATTLQPQDWTLKGSERLELLYRPEPAARFAPLARIASGGELSRLMLALQSLQPQGHRAMTLVFDEIDAGIGGKTAQTLAVHLGRLAQSHQVIVITHLAQIAAWADVHLVVRKQQDSQGSETLITRVQGEDRLLELARMLSGTQDDVAVFHARRLLDQATADKVALATVHAVAPATAHAHPIRPEAGEEATGTSSSENTMPSDNAAALGNVVPSANTMPSGKGGTKGRQRATEST